MHLREWAHSVSTDGAASAANCQFLDGLLRRGSLAATPGITIAVDQIEEQGVPCVRLRFHLPRVYHSNGVQSIPVLVLRECVGTNRYPTQFIFYALIEEIIGWLAHVGPKHTLIRLSRNNHGQTVPRSYSSNWHLLHSSFNLFISRLRHSNNPFPGLGPISDDFGVIDVAEARSSPRAISADYVVTLTLNNKQRMSLFLPHSIAKLPRELVLDWLEIQNSFSTRV
jgi:hypothetical protein